MLKPQDSFQAQEFFDEVASLVEKNCREIGFPQHKVLRCWGRRDVIIIQMTRTLLAWETALSQGQERETAQAKLWRNPAVVDLLLTRWDMYCCRRFNISATKIHCLPRFITDGQEIGYEVIELSRPLFVEPFDFGANGFVKGKCGREQLLKNSTEDRLNVELCRLLRESSGKGPIRSRFFLLDKQHLLILLSGIMTEGLLSVVDSDPKLVASLENIAKRQLLNCTHSLLRELGIRLKRFQIELDLEQNEAVVLVLI